MSGKYPGWNKVYTSHPSLHYWAWVARNFEIWDCLLISTLQQAVLFNIKVTSHQRSKMPLIADWWFQPMAVEAPRRRVVSADGGCVEGGLADGLCLNSSIAAPLFFPLIIRSEPVVSATPSCQSLESLARASSELYE